MSNVMNHHVLQKGGITRNEKEILLADRLPALSWALTIKV